MVAGGGSLRYSSDKMILNTTWDAMDSNPSRLVTLLFPIVERLAELTYGEEEENEEE
jgi:hypothetical protein